MTWYFDHLKRWRAERERVELFAASTEWLVLQHWHLDKQLRVVLDADIVVGDRRFPIYLQYPEMFPYSPPSVFPRGDVTRWSAHQFGAGGELCLEFGPDNWTSDLTGLHLLESAHRLLLQENPEAGEPVDVASRHQDSLGQSLRGKRRRLLATESLLAELAKISSGSVIAGKLAINFFDNETIYWVSELSADASSCWTDPKLPKPLISQASERSFTVFRMGSAEIPPTGTDLSGFKRQLAESGFVAAGSYVAISQDNRIQLHYLSDDTGNVFSVTTLLTGAAQVRLDAGHLMLNSRSVAIVGCGSLGSKVATMLARSGVGRFVLIDDDILQAENLVRNDMDWRDVGSHKVHALERRLLLVNPGVATESWRARVGGQEASASADTMMTLIGGCDLIVDATAAPEVLNVLSAVYAVAKKPLIWAEVFGGGIGGLIARCRPGIEPSPQHVRRGIENWFEEKGPAPVRSRRRYEAGEEASPLVADDADVSVIAAHAARFAIDLLLGRDPSLFPHSVYAIGMGVGSAFGQPFETYPIGSTFPVEQPTEAELPHDLIKEEIARFVQLFEAVKKQE